MKNTAVVDQSYWDSSYSELAFAMTPAHDALRQWLEQHVPDGDGKSCLEIGCFPGRYLSVLAAKKWEVHGVDLTPRIGEMKTWLQKSGYQTGHFEHANFFEWQAPQNYDLVCSFGFIEHFTNWEDALLKHASMVKSGGLLVIETPNFAGRIQNFLHSTLDRTNYQRHHIPAMNPTRWQLLLQDAGFVVERCEYFGAFEFWTDTPHTGFFGKAGMKLVSMLTPYWKKKKQGSASLSPYIGLIARKK